MAKKQDQLPEMQIEYWAIDRLIPYARNPRKNDDAVPKMAGLIKEFGFKVPIVARSDGEVIDGHLRLKAAQKLGLKEVPVVLADEWTPAQVKAFRLAVNKSAEWAEWDEELLKLELDELKLDDFDLPLIGFEDDITSYDYSHIEELYNEGMGNNDFGVDLPTFAVTLYFPKEEKNKVNNIISKRGKEFFVNMILYEANNVD